MHGHFGQEPKKNALTLTAGLEFNAAGRGEEYIYVVVLNNLTRCAASGFLCLEALDERRQTRFGEAVAKESTRGAPEEGDVPGQDTARPTCFFTRPPRCHARTTGSPPRTSACYTLAPRSRDFRILQRT